MASHLPALVPEEWLNVPPLIKSTFEVLFEQVCGVQRVAWMVAQ
jgi:hypothetical protein